MTVMHLLHPRLERQTGREKCFSESLTVLKPAQEQLHIITAMAIERMKLLSCNDLGLDEVCAKARAKLLQGTGLAKEAHLSRRERCFSRSRAR